MAATIRFDQSTPGPGTANRSRHDLVPGEKITCVATSPTPGPGVTYTWEILDKKGSPATLSSTSGQSVDIGADGAGGGITPFCGFKVRLTANDNGVITKTDRICSVRSPAAKLRAMLFGESAPAAQTLNNNDPDLSVDNAVYPNRSGTGITEQNPFDYTESIWELENAVEDLAVNGGSGAVTANEDFQFGGDGWSANPSGQTVQWGSMPQLPSSGVIGVTLTASDYFLLAPGWGRILGNQGPLVVTWRASLPADNTGTFTDTQCHYAFGVISVGDSGPTAGVFFSANWTGSARAWSLTTLTPSTSLDEPITLNVAGKHYFDVRLTITVSGTKVEVRLDDGLWVTVLNGANAPNLTYYVPFYTAKLDTEVQRFMLIDKCNWVGPSSPNDFAGSIAGGNSWPTSGGGAPTELQVRTALAASTGDTSFNGHKLTNLAGPTVSSDAATKNSSEQAAHDAANDEANIRNAIHSATGDFNFNNQKLTQIAGGVSLGDAWTVGQMNNAWLDGSNLQALASHLTGPASFANQRLTNVADGTADTDASTKRQTDQPPTRSDSTTTPAAISASDIGGFIKLSNASAITLATTDLSSSLRSGGCLVISIILTGGGTLTISPGAGCTVSGYVSGTSAMLWSDDGITWYVR